ncbi:MAG TPA: HDIG domain-containing metalloprotein [Anaerolineaceae bacterium]
MRLASQDQPSHWYSRQGLLRLLILFALGVLSFAALVLPIATRPSSYQVRLQEVASQDITAPWPLAYESKILTEDAQKNAELAVEPIYLPADPAIARRQIEQMRVTLAYMDSVRQDAFATVEQKLGDLEEISAVPINDELSNQILNLSEARWEMVQEESLKVLEQVMRSTIREDQVDAARRSIPTLISYSLPEDLALTITNLVSPFLQPNSLYSEEQTQAARQKSRESVAPITRSFATGEIIVRRGQIINPTVWEALEQYGLVQPRRDYPDLIADGALVVVLTAFTGLYVRRRHNQALNNPRNLLVIALTFLAFLFAARFLIPNRAIVPYIYPLAAFGLTVSTLFSIEFGMVFSLVLSILAAYGLDNSLDLTLFYILSSLCGILVLNRGRRVDTFFWTGLAIGVAGSAVILAYRLTDNYSDLIGIATLVGASFFNGLASASITLLLQYFFSQLLGLTTALQLLELMRPDHPLQQYILNNAAGSYQHSLQVSNLAEQAAEAIGADPLLTRVGALYHDAGKAANPSFFIENQGIAHLNPHDDIDPAASAATIIKHIDDGVALARRYRLPPAVQDFIREHHGTLITRYQYARALEAAGGDVTKVDMERFRYPGPRPRSRETALLMLADGVEARARAESPKNEDELRALVKKVFDFLQKEEQLEDTRLTFRDLQIARETFVKALRNAYHPRIQYPEIKPVAPVDGGDGRAAENVPTVPTPGKGKQP